MKYSGIGKTSLTFKSVIGAYTLTLKADTEKVLLVSY